MFLCYNEMFFPVLPTTENDHFRIVAISFLKQDQLCVFKLQFADENKVKAGQLGVMEAVLEALSLHKANAEVAAPVAKAIGVICFFNGALSFVEQQ